MLKDITLITQVLLEVENCGTRLLEKRILAKLPAEYLLGSQQVQQLQTNPLPNLGLFINSDNYSRIIESLTILDAWNQPLYYGWSQNLNNGIPYMRSAGPDMIWGSDDDIFSYEAD